MCQNCERLYKVNSLSEMTLRDIKSRTNITDIERVNKARKLTSYYQGVNQNKEIVFQTTSETVPGLFYTQYVKLKNLDILRKASFYQNSPRSMFYDAFNSDIEVYCTDPSFLYWGWQYISYTLSFGSHWASFPGIRNPTLYGAVCKHLYHVLMVLPFNASRIYSDMKRLGFLNVEEESQIDSLN